MSAKFAVTDEGEEITFLTFLERVAKDPRPYGLDFPDLPTIKRIPPEWKEDLILATQFEDIVDRDEFLDVCTRLLLGLDSRWVGMPGLLVDYVNSGAGIMTYQVIHWYVKKHNWFFPEGLAAAVVATHDRMPAWRKVLLWIDDPCRDLVRRARCELAEKTTRQG